MDEHRRKAAVYFELHQQEAPKTTKMFPNLMASA